MQLILKRNYTNLDVSRLCNEFVSVKTEDGSDWEHIEFRDFISYEDFKLINSTERKVACSAWRADFMDQWTHLEKEQYVVGIIISNALYIVLDDGKPLIKSDSSINDLKPRKKASVTTLLS